MFFFKKKRKKHKEQPSAACQERKGDLRCGIVGYAVSDVGRVRTNNEDNYILDGYMNKQSADHSEHFASIPEEDCGWHFAGVFDGMGGGDKGEVAARVTAETFLETCRSVDRNAPKERVDNALRGAFLKSNNEIVELQKQYRVYGTTGTVAATNGREFKIYHLGDSRAYLLRSGQLAQLTRDQTLAQMKIVTGLYDRNDPQAEIEKHRLTEYIGRDWTRENIRPVESAWIRVHSGDRLLLCSDGLYDMCSDAQIARSMDTGSNIGAAAQNLSGCALENGGEDNTTCVAIMFF